MRHDEGTLRGGGGVALRYRRWRPDGPARAAVVVCHGVAEHSGRYDHVAEFLVGRGHAVWAHDQRGHGRSGGRRVYVERFDAYVSDLEAFRLLAASCEPVPQFLLGHSMGGAIALAHAAERPGTWAGLALSAPAVAPAGAAPRAAVLGGRLVSRLAPRLGVVRLDAGATSRDPEVVAAYGRDPLVHHGRLPARLVAELVARTDRFPTEVAALSLPVLMLVAGADRLVPPDGPRRLFPRIGSADKRLVEYPGLRHELFNEPERGQVLSDLADWLDDHSRV